MMKVLVITQGWRRRPRLATGGSGLPTNVHSNCSLLGYDSGEVMDASPVSSFMARNGEKLTTTIELFKLVLRAR